MQKALLYALLMPNEKLAKLQEERRFTELMMEQEELKTYPFGDVWDYFCQMNQVPVKEQWLSLIHISCAVSGDNRQGWKSKVPSLYVLF